ncbi:MAG: hypothetical protein IT423_10015 [Pirellulaceae bacterium]|nr:hypothetical protein [Pirellulaceae bacterium]
MSYWTGRSGWWLASMLAIVAAAPGCARRAYTDVYVENMAAEIRDLEDQLYEFDGEYRLMEHELAALQAENARLKNSLPSSGGSRWSEPKPLIPAPQDGYSSESFVPRGSSSKPSGAASNTVPGPSLKTAPDSAPALDTPPTGNRSPSNVVPAMPSDSTASPNTPPNNLPNNSPSTLPPALNLPEFQRSAPANPLPPPQSSPGGVDVPFDLQDLTPPTIVPGEPLPPVIPKPQSDPATPVTLHTNNDLEIELGKIPLPARLASANVTGSATEGSDVELARVQPTAAMPTDSRIVEMKFHPSLCRAMSNDQSGRDEGLYLVLQPLNEAGEFVPLPADLMVIALDLSREEKQASIGRWTFSSSEVKSKIQPIGSSQGIHVSLPLSGPTPQCDRVLVFVYYTLSDGRRIVAEHELLLNNFHRQNTVWVPRSKRPSPTSDVGSNPVRTVSGERPIGTR